jgi:hypothetical protein
MKKLFGMLAGLALLITGGWGTAQAITLDLTVDHCTGGCGPGGGAVLAQVTLTDTAAGVDFSIMPSAGYLIHTGGNGLTTFDFSTNVPLTAASITNLTSGFAFVSPNSNQDGFGSFTAGIDGTTGTTFAGPLTFTVLGIDFSNFIMSTGGDDSTFFALDVAGNASGNTGLVGFSGLSVNPTVTPTPVPGAVWLFAGGIGGIGVLMRRRKKAINQAASAA